MASDTELILVSGFLGAGKTTFLNSLLGGAYPKERTVVLENEFGQNDLDGELLRQGGVDVVSLSAGCICCTSAGNMMAALRQIKEKFDPARIMIEPTGIALLSDVARQLDEGASKEIGRLRHVITIVDAGNYEKRLRISQEFFENQIRATRIVFLSKTEGLAPEKVTAVTEAVRTINPFCVVVAQDWRSLDSSEIEALLMLSEETGVHCVKGEEAITGADIQTFSWQLPSEGCPDPFPEKLFEALEGGEFGEVLRVKGWIRFQNGSVGKFDYVPGEYTLKPGATTAPDELCFIGRRLNKSQCSRFCGLPTSAGILSQTHLRQMEIKSI